MRPLAVIFALALITIAFEIYSNPRWRTRRSLTLLPRSRDGGHRPWPQTRLVSALHTDELKIAAALSDAEPLQEELKDFQRKVSDAGRATYNARTGAHDDLVLADKALAARPPQLAGLVQFKAKALDVAYWWILLKKSFWGDDRNFLEPLMRSTRGDVRDHIDSSKIDRGPS